MVGGGVRDHDGLAGAEDVAGDPGGLLEPSPGVARGKPARPSAQPESEYIPHSSPITLTQLSTTHPSARPPACHPTTMCR